MSQKKAKTKRRSIKKENTKMGNLYKGWVSSILGMNLRNRISIANNIIKGMKNKASHIFIMILLFLTISSFWAGVGAFLYCYFIEVNK